MLPRSLVATFCLVLASPLLDAAGSPRVVVEADAPGHAVSPQFVGVFFEDINFAADGGLSAELIRNGSFEFEDPITGWHKIERPGSVGGYGIHTQDAPFERNPHYARIAGSELGEGFGLRNSGYRGMGLKQGARYRFSVWARAEDDHPHVLDVHLLGARDVVLGATTITVEGRSWRRVSAELEAGATEAKGALRLMLRQPGTIDLDVVSLMPVDTWKGRANGLRADLVQLLADLKPGFIRFPGGCIVEGRTLANRYQWKHTVGPVENRATIYNRWNVEFADRGRGAQDYYQSFRLGFFEYFQLCDDLGAVPVPIVNCGMACQFNSGELVPLDELGPYVQDALDLIEFANGDVSTTWGRVRAEMGRPEPFGLTMIGIGNEQWGPQYFERYAVFAEAIRARHPEIKLVTGTGPSPEDARFRQAWQAIRGLPADVVDEHGYSPPEWFLNNSTRYDRQDRRGPRVFMGEYAAHEPDNKNTWRSALAEAAYLTGMERNADVVTMTSYAPLFAHVDAWQWSPNLIWFDNLRSVGTANYEVQRLFSLHRGDRSLPTRVEHAPQENGHSRLYASAQVDDTTHELILKIVNATATEQTVDLDLSGGARAATRPGRRIVVSADLTAENTVDAPHHVAAREETFEASSAIPDPTLPAWSLTILRLPVQ